MPPFSHGELALLIDRQDNRYLLRLRESGEFHFHRGVVPHSQIIGGEEGCTVVSTLGTELVAFRPRLSEYLLEMARSTAIIYPKDIGFILLWADVRPGDAVLEAGMGSGALTIALLRAVGPAGKVISYEAREDLAQKALENVRGFAGDPVNLHVRIRDVYQGIEESQLDHIVLDVAEPWRVVEASAAALRRGGSLCVYTPAVTQAQATVEALRREGRFAQIETLEALYRPWHIRGQSVRPVQHMVAHTGFLTFARKSAPRPGQEIGQEEQEQPQ